MTCVIIEDQAPAQRVLKKYIRDMGTLELKQTFTDAIQALEFLKENPVELIFLDIHLPKLSGIDFLRALPNPPLVIMTTAFSDYAVQSYELDVVDYLLKPFSFERFVKAVNKADQFQAGQKSSLLPSGEKAFFIKSGYEYIKVNSRDILYICTDMDYTEIHLSDKKYLSPETLASWETRLGPADFIRVHKSFLINGSKVEKIASNQIFLSPEHIVPIGRAYKEDFMKRMVE
ncbi:MAG: response regulator transcription factor [Bacteroidetes bacterium]|nr:response regulator transcription factor [Bacteroidota bacterium]